MNEQTFYDRSGEPIAYSEDGSNIYLFSGEPVAYIKDEYVYSFSGSQLGTFENGWIRDLDGDCVFFTDDADGSGPIKPIKDIKPLKDLKEICPIKEIPEIPQIKSMPLHLICTGNMFRMLSTPSMRRRLQVWDYIIAGQLLLVLE